MYRPGRAPRSSPRASMLRGPGHRRDPGPCRCGPVARPRGNGLRPPAPSSGHLTPTLHRAGRPRLRDLLWVAQGRAGARTLREQPRRGVHLACSAGAGSPTIPRVTRSSRCCTPSWRSRLLPQCHWSPPFQPMLRPLLPPNRARRRSCRGYRWRWRPAPSPRSSAALEEVLGQLEELRELQRVGSVLRVEVEKLDQRHRVYMQTHPDRLDPAIQLAGLYSNRSGAVDVIEVARDGAVPITGWRAWAPALPGPLVAPFAVC